MSFDELKKEVDVIWEYVQSPYDHNPSEVKLRLSTLSSYFSFVQYNIPKAKKRYTDVLKSGLMQLAEDAISLDISKNLQTALIDSVKGDERMLWDELLQLDRAISKDMAACTSILSYIKVEMDISRHQSH